VIDLGLESPAYEPIPEQPCFLGERACAYFQYDAWSMVLAIWVGCHLIWSIFLTLQQTWLIMRGHTTNEHLNKARYKNEINTWREGPSGNPYDLGCRRNCINFFRGDGVDWMQVHDQDDAVARLERHARQQGDDDRDHIPLMAV
jgi:hypothetical protein